LPVRALVTWLACSNVCVPGQATIATTLNVVPAPVTGVAAVLSFIALAFVGGLVLNLMPCVFPVLSFKALRAIGEPYERRLRTAIAYTAGVTSSCTGLGIALIVARSAGHALGWGFQLQSPIFVGALAVLMIGLALAMSGFIELTLPIPAPLARRAATAGAFGDGVLVTLIASACIAPYMGAALGFALAASAPVALGVFIALGLGIALPHALLMLSPVLLGWLPKPGPWLITARRVLALPLYLSAAWLVWVFVQQVLPPNVVSSAIAGSPQTGVATTFSTANLAALRRAHRPVLVEVGAAWCITCQVNERFALDRPEVTARLRTLGVTVVHADWTSQNPQITAYLHALGAAGVPLYVYYRADGTDEVWPQVLTAGAITERLKSRVG
jgi:thiol:disulfide interchange protein